MVPPGVWIEIGHDVGRRFMTGASIVQKCAVLPVSAMAGTDGGSAMVGGPTGARAAGSGGLATGITITSLRVTLEDGAVARGVGFPPGQAEDVGGGAEAGALPRGVRPPRRMVLLPPIMWRVVAVVWWPGPGRLQVALVCVRLVPRPCVQQ
jgi:hypothetical protein